MILRLIIIVLITYFVYETQINFLPLEYFKIKSIQIKTVKEDENSKILYNDLTELTKNIYNKNIWEINIDEIKQKLKEDVRIESLEISKTKIDEITIIFKEKKAKYYLQMNNRIYLLDNSGEAFGYYNEKPNLALPAIVFKEQVSEEVGEKVSTEVSDCLEILKTLENTGMKNLVSQIYKKQENNIVLLLLDGTEIMTNKEVLEDKYETTESLYLSLGKEKKIKYIDIRFDDYIIKYTGEVE